MKRYSLSLALLLLLAPLLVSTLLVSPLLAQPAGGTALRPDPELLECQVSFLQHNYIAISAEQPGVLRELLVREGSSAAEGVLLAQIDDQEAVMGHHVAEQKRQAAIAQYKDEIEKKYAIAAANVAKADYDDLKAANAKLPKAVSETDLRRAKLEWDRAKLQIQKADKDKELAGYEYFIRKAEVAAANMQIDRMKVKAPYAGEVIELFRKQGEWVNPGDPILRFVRFDTLECDGKVLLKDYDPREIEGCEVTISAVVGRGVTVKAKGRITYVEQQVQYEGDYTYRVQAEIPNRQEGGRWVLFPGLPATMTIHLGTAQPRPVQ